MRVLSFCFCRDTAGQFGLVREFNAGSLLVTFDDGDRWVKPAELTFI